MLCNVYFTLTMFPQCTDQLVTLQSHSLWLFSILSLSKTSDPYNKLLIQLKDFVEF